MSPNTGKEENCRNVPLLGWGSRATTSVSSWDVGCGLGAVAVRRSERGWEMSISSDRKKVPKDVKFLMTGKALGDMMTVVIIRTIGGHQ